MFSKGLPFLLLKSWTVANGEVLLGKPKTVKATSVNTAMARASYPPQSNLAFAWDAVYGQGFFVAHILDNQGNTFKMVW